MYNSLSVKAIRLSEYQCLKEYILGVSLNIWILNESAHGISIHLQLHIIHGTLCSVSTAKYNHASIASKRNVASCAVRTSKPKVQSPEGQHRYITSSGLDIGIGLEGQIVDGHVLMERVDLADAVKQRGLDTANDLAKGDSCIHQGRFLYFCFCT